MEKEEDLEITKFDKFLFGCFIVFGCILLLVFFVIPLAYLFLLIIIWLFENGLSGVWDLRKHIERERKLEVDKNGK